MDSVSTSAPAKLILCGEHAVVYQRPAIAVPVAGVRARATATPWPTGVVIDTPDLEQRWEVESAPDHPFSELVRNLLSHLAVRNPPGVLITIRSDIPTASGMGSGAAVATALVRTLAGFLGRELPPEEVSALVYASERRFHGTPSGIDNTVIAFEQPIWFIRSAGTTDHPPSMPPDPSPITYHPSPITQSPLIEPIAIAAPLTLLIGDTGVRSETRLPVGEVRHRWEAEPRRYEALFDEVAVVVAAARRTLTSGDLPALGALLLRNHALLQTIGVSSPELDRLVAAAQEAGALGAKLSGGGWGGVMFALVAPPARAPVAEALARAGAVRVIETVVTSS
jgi:mevalonate kinase